MLELYKGQITPDYIKYDIPYKEALLMRDTRIARLKKEREQIEKEREAEAAKMKQQQFRQSFLKK